MSDGDMRVTGGSGGTYAEFADLDQLASGNGEAGLHLAGIAAETHRFLVHPDVIASAVLDPAGVARFESALLAALDGSGGLTALAVRLESDAVRIKTVATLYRVTDEAQAHLIDTIRWQWGFLFGRALPFIGPGLLVGTGGLFLLGDWAGVDWERFLSDHPGIVDNLVGVSPGLITGLIGARLVPPIHVSDVPAGARLFGLLYPDGRGMADGRGVDTLDPSMTRPPAGYGDLIDGLRYRNSQAPGEIDVRILTHPDGSRSYIVDIPGTKDWQPMPLRHYDKLNDLGTNIHAMAGEETAYQQAIADALRQAGARPDEPVMLIGHSQGGIVAANMASGSDEFNITHVVTAGSPVGRIDVPDSVQMLSLENEYDIVPHLDASDNPDRPNRTTVTFDNQHGTIGDNHGIQQSYLPVAETLDSSTHPSITAYRDSASAFLPGNDGTTVTAHVYQTSRVP